MFRDRSKETPMQKLLGLPIVAVAVLGGCTPGPDRTTFVSHAQIDVLPPGDSPVTGSEFACSGDWPSAVTPCNYPWTSRPVTRASDQSDGRVQMSLGRSPDPVDGGASSVVLVLQFGFQETIGVFVYETTTRPDLQPPTETSEPVSGWIEPDVVGHNAAQRNAGRLSLSFAWGSISGSYDTDDTAPAP
jgi:hypothetical protein